MVKLTPLTKRDVPVRRRDKTKLVEIPDVVTVEETGKEIDISTTTNPLARLGMMGTGSTTRFIKTPLNVRGVVQLPQTSQRGVEFEGGPILPSSALAEFHRADFPEARPIEVGEVTLVGKGAENPRTPAHEFMHLGLNSIRDRFTQEEFGFKYGEDFAEILYSEEMEHPLLQAIFQSKGQPAFNQYMKDMTPEETQLVFRTIEPIFDLSLEILTQAGVEPRAVKGETPEEEAGRKMQREAFTEEEAKGFLANIKSFLFGG
jgi:hypothetical protein